MKNKLKYEELQANIPDYIFGAMSDSEKFEFESYFEIYPELKDEIDDFSLQFSKIEKSKLNHQFDSKTRNLSVKVTNKLEKTKPYFSKIFPQLAAGLSFIVIVVLGAVILIPDIEQATKVTKNVISDNSIFNKIDEAILFDDGITEEHLLESQYYLSGDLAYMNILTDEDVIEEVADIVMYDTMADIIEETGSETKIDLMIKEPTNNIDVYEELNSMSDDEFENFMKELENVEIL